MISSSIRFSTTSGGFSGGGRRHGPSVPGRGEVCRPSGRRYASQTGRRGGDAAAGYPLDTTFYQSVKGMVAGMEIVRPGGTIILAASMSEGIGSPEFCHAFEKYATPEIFLERILQADSVTLDQWQVEELAKVCRKARIVVVSDGLPPETLRRLYVETVPSVEIAVADCLSHYGPDATIAVIPKGPYVIAGLGLGT